MQYLLKLKPKFGYVKPNFWPKNPPIQGYNQSQKRPRRLFSLALNNEGLLDIRGLDEAPEAPEDNFVELELVESLDDFSTFDEIALALLEVDLLVTKHLSWHSCTDSNLFRERAQWPLKKGSQDAEVTL